LKSILFRMNPSLSSASETSDKIPPRQVPPATPVKDAGDGSPGTAPLKKKKRGRFWKALGLTLLFGSAAGAVYLTATPHGQQFAKDTQENIIAPVQVAWDVKQNPGVLFDQANSDVVNILLIGRDRDYKQVYRNGRNVAHKVDETAKARSDTMIIVSLNRTRKTIRMVSLPRDAMVNMPENPENSGVDKLNAAHAYGGVPLLRQVLHDELGITIHHYAVIKFDGFKKVIDKVGGVYVDVLGALHRDGTVGPLKYEDKWGGWKVDLQPGKQWLNGEQAHGYVRFRMDVVGDPRRIQRQQSVMRALARRLKEIRPWELPGVLSEMRRQFETDLSDEQLVSAGFFAKDEVGETAKIQPITLYGSYTTKGSVRLNRRRNKALLKAIFGPTFNEDRWLSDSPSVRGYEFGPDEDKPEVRELLIEAGLIEGTARVAQNEAGAASGSANREGVSTSPLSSPPPPVTFGLRESPSPLPLSAPPSALAGERSNPRVFSAPRVEPRLEAVPTVEGDALTPRAEPRRERVLGQSLPPEPAAGALSVPSESAQGSTDGGTDLSVESPIPQPVD
jgi:LCP family protein required for cell wall assembly